MTRALIVDDNPDIVSAVGDMVASRGHEYDSAGELESTRHMLESKPYDYLILDMNLPVSKNRDSAAVCLQRPRARVHRKQTSRE